MTTGYNFGLASETQLATKWGGYGTDMWAIDIFLTPGVDHYHAVLAKRADGTFKLKMKNYPQDHRERRVIPAVALDRAFVVATSHLLNWRDSHQQTDEVA
jgi:hypothetical protein